MRLAVIDWAIVAAYVGVILAIGFWSLRRIRDAGGFLLGNRKLGTGMMIASTFAGGINANHPVSVAANTYTNGLSGMWLSLAYILATPMFWMWPPALRRLRIVTMVDFFRMRYGRVMEWFNLLNAVVVAPFGFGVGIKAAAILVVAVSGTDASGAPMIGMHTAIAMIVIPTLIYTLMGGVVAAYAVDMFQSLLIVVLSFLLLPFMIWKVGGMAEIETRVASAQPGSWDLLGTGGGVPGIWLFWFAVSLFFSAPMVYGGGSGGARNEMAARWAIIGNLAKRFCTLGWGLTGVFAIAMLGAKAVSGVKPEDVFARACLDALPAGLRGVMVAAMLAAVMSTIAGMMLGFGGNMVNNLYKDYLVRNASTSHYLLMARVFTGASVFLGWAVAASDLGLVHNVVIVEQISGMLGVTVLAALVWRRATAAGAVVAALAMAPLFYWGNRPGSKWPEWYRWIAERVLDGYHAIGIDPHVTSEAFARLRPEELVQVTTPIFLFAGIVAVVAVSLFTRQHSEHAVAEFYARLETPLGEERKLREAGFKADTLEELDLAEIDAAAEDRDISRRLLLPDLFRWPGLILRGKARLSDYWVDLAGIAGSVVFIMLFLKGIGWFIDWLRPG
jgi:SSS family solute:Na+ symporter